MNLPVSVVIMSKGLLENIQFHMEPLLVTDSSGCGCSPHGGVTWNSIKSLCGWYLPIRLYGTTNLEIQNLDSHSCENLKYYN
jgi:hypothetical protein